MLCSAIGTPKKGPNGGRSRGVRGKKDLLRSFASPVGTLGKAGTVVSSAKPMQASGMPWVASWYAMNQACSGLRHGLDSSEPMRAARLVCSTLETFTPHTLTTLFLLQVWSGCTSHC